MSTFTMKLTIAERTLVFNEAYLTPREYLSASPEQLLFSTTALHFLVVTQYSVLNIQNKPTGQNRGGAQTLIYYFSLKQQLTHIFFLKTTKNPF